MKINIKNLKVAAIHFARTWITVFPRILYRSSLSLIFAPKKSQKFIHQVLNTIDIYEEDPVLENTDITSLLNDTQIDISITGSPYRSDSSETRLLKEISCLAYMTKVLKPSVVFEIGTFIGRTTRLLSENTGQECRIYTLDLPEQCVSHRIGCEFLDTSQADKIVQLNGDSMDFDFSPWYGKCDFVWIDGCHDYRYVVKDTENALRLLAPGGWLAWHDYRHTAWWSGVTRHVRELYKSFPDIVRIRETTMAVLPGKVKE